MSNKLIEVAVTILHETVMAFLVDDGINQVWLPKSQIKDHEDISIGETLEIEIPEWLAIDKEII